MNPASLRCRRFGPNALAVLSLAGASSAALALPVTNITQGLEYSTIQGAINASVNGDVIEADPGTYLENIAFGGRDITVRSSSGNPADTIIDGGGTASCVQIVGSTAAALLEGFTLTNGSFVGGGGVYIASGSATLRGCVFKNNHATSGGGALYLPFDTAYALVIDCTFLGNTAANSAGAVYCPSSSPEFINCLFSGNSAPSSGSAIYAPSSGVSLTNCTFAGNTGGSSGVIRFTPGAATPASVTNCIVWGNSSNLVDSSGTTVYAYNDLQGGVPAGTVSAGGNISVNPQFADADGADNTAGTLDDNLRLGAASPCIDAGDNTASGLSGISEDLDADSRFIDVPSVADTGNGAAPIIDMGPYEVQLRVHNITQGLGYAAIQAAIAAAADGDVIEADPGTYFELINFLGKDITVRSASGDPTDTIIDGSNAGQVVTCISGEGPSSVLDGFTITHGFSPAVGGGLFVIGSTPTISRCVFSANHVGVGGGAVCAANAGADPTIIDCAFLGNISDNHGGAVYCSSSSPAFINCLFSGNSAPSSGSAMYAPASGVSLTNCTFSGHTGGSSGVIRFTSGGDPASVTNCIVWGNSSNLVDSSGTTVYAYNDLQGGVPAGTVNAGGNVSVSPQFVDYDGADNTPGTLDDNLRLGPTSPCIDAGDNTTPGLSGIAVDLDGSPRFDDLSSVADTGNGVAPIVDMGPYEAQLRVHNVTQGLGYATIQGAINGAVNGDVIEANPGTYFENILILNKKITVRSASGNPADTIINGGGTSICVQIVGVTTVAVLEGFTVTDGLSGSGAGVNVFSGSATIRGCVFIANHASGAGGAMCIQTNTAGLVVIDCVFLANHAPTGGAVYCPFSNPQFINCLFSGNSATGYGSAIHAPASGISLTNCTFAGNSGGSGSVIRLVGGGNPASVTNCIVWGNASNLYDASGTTVYAYNDLQGGVPAGTVNAGGNFDADPMFADADLRVAPRSRCIDAGNNTTPGLSGITADLDANPRFHDDPGRIDTGSGTAPIVDVGCYEFQGVSPSCSGDVNDDGSTNSADFNILAGHFGASVAPHTSGDLTGDGVVNSADFNILAGDFGCDVN